MKNELCSTSSVQLLVVVRCRHSSTSLCVITFVLLHREGEDDEWLQFTRNKNQLLSTHGEMQKETKMAMGPPAAVHSIGQQRRRVEFEDQISTSWFSQQNRIESETIAE